jgi:hypothetical protein
MWRRALQAACSMAPLYVWRQLMCNTPFNKQCVILLNDVYYCRCALEYVDENIESIEGVNVTSCAYKGFSKEHNGYIIAVSGDEVDADE